MATQQLNLTSSAFWRVMWDDESLNLYVVFSGARGAPQYVYPGVGEDLIAEWQKAPSAGQYFHEHIKPLADSGVRKFRQRNPRFFNQALRYP